jgi:hypothetical protein
MTSLIACTLFCSSVFLQHGIVAYNKSQEKSSKLQEKPKHKLETEKELFQNTFQNSSTENIDKENSRAYNVNIDKSLYDYKTHENHSSEHFGQLEKLWSTRILLQDTLYGNIIMYYDLFRQAFVYYSDVQVNYSLLNLIAMKYVRMYSCRDFFVDSQVLPDDYTNPFNQMKEDEIEREKQKKKEKRVKMNLNLDSSVFVQKKKKTSSTDKTTDTKSTDQEKTDRPIYKNNFRFLGKLNNFSFLQPISIKKLKAAAAVAKASMESKSSAITDHYDYVTFKDTVANSPIHGAKAESSPFYKKFEELLI